MDLRSLSEEGIGAVEVPDRVLLKRLRYPLVLIVGRPNVGKSTLWNALIGRHRAIVHDMPGVTRDILVYPVRVGRYWVNLADTGGLLPEHAPPEDVLRELASARVRAWMRSASLILFVVEAKGVVPADVELFRQVRQSGVPVLLVVNKADSAEADRLEEVAELLEGDIPYVFVSALHRRNLETLRARIEELLAQEGVPVDLKPVDESGLRVAIVGRPNTGKSTLFNRLAGSSVALVSPIPGTTRDLIEIPIRYHHQTIYLVDTAGLRKPARVSTPLEAYTITRTVKAIEQAHVVVLLMDATEPATHQDLKIFRVILRRHKGVVVALNKWDQVQDKHPREQEAIRQWVAARLKPFQDVPILTISALTGKRLPQLLGEVWRVWERYRFRVPTGVLNRFIHQLVEEHPPRGVGGVVPNFKYCVQAEVAPPVFVFQVSRPRALRKEYIRFLEKQIRRRWDFCGVPIGFVFRTSKGEGGVRVEWWSGG